MKIRNVKEIGETQIVLSWFLCILILSVSASTEAQFGGPAKVVVGTVREGLLTPRQGFPGTVFFKEVSDVATEISGKVIEVQFEEGQRVKQGQILVRMDTALLVHQLRASKANVKRFETGLRESQVRYERAKASFEGGVTTQEQFDTAHFEVESISHQIESTQADVDRIETRLSKYSIYAPFDGVVIERDTELGEWKSDGDTVAVIAREGAFDIIANVMEEFLPWIHASDIVPIELVSGNRRIEGTIVTVIPRGDIDSRTFPVKIRVTGHGDLFEGMSAIAEMPTGDDSRCALVPRDALLNQAGLDYLFTVEDGLAVQHPVNVLGYDGLLAGVPLDQIDIRFPVIIKGHERIRGGSKVDIVGEGSLKVQVQRGDG